MNKGGLEGIVAAQTQICYIDGLKGELRYRGYHIKDLAEHANFEQTAYLLWHGDFPTMEQYREFCHEVHSQLGLPKEMMSILFDLPHTAGPMQTLRTAISALGLHDPDANDNSPEANMRKSMHLMAHVPEIVAANYRLEVGQWPLEPLDRCGIAANFLWMLKGVEPTPIETDAMDTCLVLHAEHDFNASTFAARVTASTLSDMHSAITSAVGALLGALHGGANQRVMEMLEEIGNVKKAEAYVKNALATGQRIMGFGHRVYQVEDPRAGILRDISRKLCEHTGNSHYFDISEKIREVTFAEKGLNPNVDFYSASVLHALGIKTELFTTIFAVARVVGWAAHIMEQYSDNRLIRPLTDYVGQRDRELTPLDTCPHRH